MIRTSLQRTTVDSTRRFPIHDLEIPAHLPGNNSTFLMAAPKGTGTPTSDSAGGGIRGCSGSGDDGGNNTRRLSDGEHLILSILSQDAEYRLEDVIRKASDALAPRTVEQYLAKLRSEGYVEPKSDSII